MTLNVVRFFAILFAALALVPSGAHLAALPHKIGLSAAEYLTVQQIYRGWALFGIVVFGALLSTLLLAILVRGSGRTFTCTLIAFLCIAATQVAFWIFTFPVNQATANWTSLPPDWEVLRAQWEYSHAASAGLNLIALAALVLSVAGARNTAVPDR
jgi:hypothetical protein